MQEAQELMPKSFAGDLSSRSSLGLPLNSLLTPVTVSPIYRSTSVLAAGSTECGGERRRRQPNNALRLD